MLGSWRCRADKKFGANKLVVRWINVKNEVYEYRD